MNMNARKRQLQEERLAAINQGNAKRYAQKAMQENLGSERFKFLSEMMAAIEGIAGRSIAVMKAHDHESDSVKFLICSVLPHYTPNGQPVPNSMSQIVPVAMLFPEVDDENPFDRFELLMDEDIPNDSDDPAVDDSGPPAGDSDGDISSQSDTERSGLIYPGSNPGD